MKKSVVQNRLEMHIFGDRWLSGKLWRILIVVNLARNMCWWSIAVGKKSDSVSTCRWRLNFVILGVMRGDRIFDNFLSIFCQISILTPNFYVWNTFSFGYRTFSGRVMRENRHFWQFSVNFLSNLSPNFKFWRLTMPRRQLLCSTHYTHCIRTTK